MLMIFITHFELHNYVERHPDPQIDFPQRDAFLLFMVYLGLHTAILPPKE